MKLQITKQEVQALALDLINAIKANTQSGKDRFGKRFTPYSQRPFAMPYGAVLSKAKRKQAIKAGEISFFRNTKGEKRKATKGLWITWRGGYRQYKGFMKPNENTAVVNLDLTGRMLRNIRLKNIDLSEHLELVLNKENMITGATIRVPTVEITIGFGMEKEALKAEWNINRGRDFMGLPDAQLDEIIKQHFSNRGFGE